MNGKFKLGDMVQKTKGSSWRGKVVGFYSTNLTPEGYAVESETEKGSVQIYPVGALEFVDGPSELDRLRQQNAELVEEINKLKQAKEINKYDTHYPDDGFGGYPSVYNRR